MAFKDAQALVLRCFKISVGPTALGESLGRRATPQLCTVIRWACSRCVITWWLPLQAKSILWCHSVWSRKRLCIPSLYIRIVQSQYIVCQKPKATRPQPSIWQPTVLDNEPRYQNLQTETKKHRTGEI